MTDAKSDSRGDSDAGINVFVSYSRKDMAFADRLDRALRENGVTPMIDRAEIFAFEDWWARIKALIEKADNVIFVLSPDAAASEECAKEVAFAVSLNKRLSPIVYRPVEEARIPRELARLNFLFFDSDDKFEPSLAKLMDALRTDIAWVRSHTDYGQIAREWDAAKRPGGLLLRSPRLEEAEHWISSRPSRAPQPTELTRALITQSRVGATRRRNALVGGLSAGLIVAIALAGLAFVQRQDAVAQRQEAVTQRQEALAQKQNALSETRIAEEQKRVAEDNLRIANEQREAARKEREKNQISGSRLMAVAAQQVLLEDRVTDAQAIALNGLPESASGERPFVDQTYKTLLRAARADHAIVTLDASGANLLSAAFTPDGRRLLTGDGSGRLSVWNLTTFALERRIETKNDTITQIDVSADGQRALVSGGKTPGVWDIASGKLALALPQIENGFARTARFSGNGTRIALGYQSNHAEIRDARTGALLRDLKGPTNFDAAYKGRKFGPWGKTGVADPIVKAVEEAQYRMWGGMTDVAFSPDGKLVAAAGMADAEEAARLYNVEDGKLVAKLDGGTLSNNYNNQRMAFSPNGAHLAIAARDHAVRIWRLPGGQLEQTLPQTVDAESLVFDRAGAFLAAGYEDGSVRIWSVEDGRMLTVIKAHASTVTSIVFSPDESLLATSSSDRDVHLYWNTLTQDKCGAEDRRFCDVSMESAGTLRGHSDVVQQMLFSPDGASLASVSRDGTIRLWRSQERGTRSLPAEVNDRGSYQIGAFVDPAANISFSGDGKRLVAATGFKAFTVWNAADGSVACGVAGDRLSRSPSDGEIKVHDNPFKGHATTCGAKPDEPNEDSEIGSNENDWQLSPDGARAVLDETWFGARVDWSVNLSREGRRRWLVETSTRRKIAPLEFEGRYVKKVYWSQDSGVVLGLLGTGRETEATDLSKAALWDARTGALLGATGNAGYGLTIVSLSRDGHDLLVAKDGYRSVSRFKIDASGKMTGVDISAPNRTLHTAAMGPNGNLVAAAYIDGAIQLYSGPDNAPAGALLAGDALVTKLVFSDDQKLLAGVDAHRKIWIWDVASRVVLASSPFRVEPTALVFSPKGDRLAVQTVDTALHVISTGLDWLSLDKPDDVLDWARGALASALNTNDRQRFLLDEETANERPITLADLGPLAYPKPAKDLSRAEELKACDALAAHPDDRLRQGEGIAFDGIDVARAAPACDLAVQLFPHDAASIYQRGRVAERAGRVQDALAGYKAAADLGYATAAKRIAQMISGKTAGETFGSDTYDTWMARAAELGDPYGQMRAAYLAASNGGPGAAPRALRFAAAAYSDNLANGALQLALDVDANAQDEAGRESAYFYLKLATRLLRGVAPDDYDHDKADRVEISLRTSPRLLKPAAVARVYRAVRDWRPPGAKSP